MHARLKTIPSTSLKSYEVASEPEFMDSAGISNSGIFQVFNRVPISYRKKK